MRRYDPFVTPDSVFPYEGTLKSHSTGSYMRGNWLMRAESALRAEHGHAPLDLDRAFQKLLHKTHDLGELGETRDVLQGNKTDTDRILEQNRFSQYATLVAERNPALYERLLQIQQITEDPQASVSGRFWKNGVECLGFLETARRLHETVIVGRMVDEATLNEESGIYLGHSFQTDLTGQPIQPTLIGPQALIADILINSAVGGLRASVEFLSARRYLCRYAAQYQSLYQIYVLDTNQNELLLNQIRTLKQYTAAAATSHGTRQTQTAPFIAHLNTLASIELDAALNSGDTYTTLVDGQEFQLAS